MNRTFILSISLTLGVFVFFTPSVQAITTQEYAEGLAGSLWRGSGTVTDENMDVCPDFDPLAVDEGDALVLGLYISSNADVKKKSSTKSTLQSHSSRMYFGDLTPSVDAKVVLKKKKSGYSITAKGTGSRTGGDYSVRLTNAKLNSDMELTQGTFKFRQVTDGVACKATATINSALEAR